MLPKQNSFQNPMFFQIHKNGSAVDGVSYTTLEEASAALAKAAQGGEVTAVDGLDRIVRRYTADECRTARNFGNKA
jgi:hypothetical protein